MGLIARIFTFLAILAAPLGCATDPAFEESDTADDTSNDSETFDDVPTDHTSNDTSNDSETTSNDSETFDDDTATHGSGGRTPTEVCSRWLADRGDLSEGTWNGEVDTSADPDVCDPGDMEGPWRARVLTLVNLYRWLVELPPVTTDPAKNAGSQECALFMHANDTMSHSWPLPDTSYTCHTAAREAATNQGFIAGASATGAVDLYVVDMGASNEDMLGHRRYLFHHTLGPIGIGSTTDYSCMWALGGTGTADPDWVAYPPPGPVPAEALSPLSPWHVAQGHTVNHTGWSFQSHKLTLDGATMSVGQDGTPLAGDSRLLGDIPSMGKALAFVPNGWTPSPGNTYDVTISGPFPNITYSVEVVDCTTL